MRTKLPDIRCDDSDNRNIKQILTDRLLLLYLIECCNQHGKADGKTKLQKFIFLI